MEFVLGLILGLVMGFAVVAWILRGRRLSQHSPAPTTPNVPPKAGEFVPVFDPDPTVARLDPALQNLLRHASTPPNDDRDPEQLLADGLRAFTETGGVSTLVLQRRLQLDFAQATILIEEMERRGYVSAKHEQKQRRLLPSAYEFVRGIE